MMLSLAVLVVTSSVRAESLTVSIPGENGTLSVGDGLNVDLPSGPAFAEPAVAARMIEQPKAEPASAVSIQDETLLADMKPLGMDNGVALKDAVAAQPPARPMAVLPSPVVTALPDLPGITEARVDRWAFSRIQTLGGALALCLGLLLAAEVGARKAAAAS